MNFVKKHKKTLSVSLLLVLGLLVRYKIILFGLPYSLNADETYVYKDPLKILLLYKNADFSQPFNLVDWLVGLWTGIMFIIGKLFHQWQNLNSFVDLLIAEDGKIIFAYRVLSLLASVIGNIILYHLCTRITTHWLLRMAFALTFLFNPVEILSDNWLKYDPFVFLSFCILLNYSYSYFFLLQKDLIKKLYIFSLIAIAVRIDFIAFFISIFVYDCYLNYFNMSSRDFLNNLKRKFVYILSGVLLYCIITLYPLVYFYNWFFPAAAHLGITKSFEAVISSRLMTFFHSGTLFNNITNNLFFFSNVCFLALGPVIIIFLFLFFFKTKRTKYLLLFIIFTGAILLLYSAHDTHYFLTLSVIFIFGSCVYISQLKNFHLQIICAVCNLAYVSTVSFSFLYAITTSKDPRLSSAEYIAQNINPADLLAIETHSMNGLGPPVNECKDVLLKKSEITAKLGSGTGETYRMKANTSTTDCREILDIFSTDYFAGSAYENVWINTYNKDLFAKRNPEYYITTHSFHIKPEGGMLPAGSTATEFYDYLAANYTLIKEFRCSFFDPRLPHLLDCGVYFRPVRIYKRIK